MDKVIVDQSFWELFPDAQVNILYANGIDNHDTDKNLAERREMLANATKEAGKFLTNETFRLNSVVDQWRCYCRYPPLDRSGQRSALG